MKRLKHELAESDHIVAPFVSDTLGSMSGESAVTLCLFAWCQTVQETEFFLEDWGDGAGADNGNSALVEASKRALHRWDALLTLAVWRATAARATGPGVNVFQNRGSRRNKAALSPEMGVFAPPSPLFAPMLAKTTFTRVVHSARSTLAPKRQNARRAVAGQARLKTVDSERTRLGVDR